MKICRLFYAVSFFEILPKLSDFVNSDDCIEKKKNISKSIRLYPVFFSIEKMRNSGNCIDDYGHSFFEEDF